MITVLVVMLDAAQACVNLAETQPVANVFRVLGKHLLLRHLNKIPRNLPVTVLKGTDYVVLVHVATIARIMANVPKRILWFELVRTKR